MSVESPADPLVKDVIGMLFELTGRLRAHMDRCAAELDLTPMQARALFVSQEPVPMRDLAEALHCDASNVTGIVDRLEDLGLMARVVDPEDRRRKNLVVTEEGTATSARLRTLLQAGNPVLVLDDDQLGLLHGMLQTVLGEWSCERPASP
jgi:DNA-binding MarR family transcriptional regulator